LKSIKTDMYVDETVKMVSSLIHPQTATVLK